ncbi:MAG: hypothetical protein VCC67_11960 [Myxococcota bacterium]
MKGTSRAGDTQAVEADRSLESQRECITRTERILGTGRDSQHPGNGSTPGVEGC